MLEKRRKRKDGLFPVKIRVTHNRYAKYYATGFALISADFEKVMGKAPRNDHKVIRKKLVDLEDKARIILNELPEFSFDEFEDQFLNKKPKTDNFLKLLEEKIKSLQERGQIKTARSNQNTLRTLKWYTGKSTLPIRKVNMKFLEGYEAWMIGKGRSITTVGIYCRNIRAVFNDAIADGIVKYDFYPFGKRKYQIPTGKNIKKALTKEDVLKIINYQPTNDIEAYSRDLWVFSYLANGMNFTDIANLTADSLVDGFIVFTRSKTNRSTRSKPILIKVFILDKMQEIIEQHGNQEGYLFPILRNEMTLEQQINKIELAIRSINHHIGKIAKTVGIEKKVTTYTARHTFSTVLKRSGASIEFIADSLGHASILTTRAYLDSFEDEEKKKWSEKLL